MDLTESGPISFSMMLDRMFSVYRRFFLSLVGVAAVPYLFLGGIFSLSILAAGSSAPTRTHPGSGPPAPVAADVFIGFAIIFGMFGLISSFAWVATSVAVWDIQMGLRPRIARAYWFTLKRIGTILVAGFLGLIAVLAGYALLVIPGIIILLSISLTSVVIAAEGKGPIDSLMRSWELSIGYRWRILGTMFVCGIFSAIIGYAMLIPGAITLSVASSGGTQPIWATILFFLVYTLGLALPAPLLAIALCLIYYDARVRKEGFDLQRMLDTLPAATGAAAPQTPAIG